MLVLSRKLGEQILLGYSIRITVLSISDGRVRLGFAAPADVRILRKEMICQAGPAAGPNGSEPKTER
jgi:carbon storage regulator